LEAKVLEAKVLDAFAVRGSADSLVAWRALAICREADLRDAATREVDLRTV
jgi:hypothetical protein